MSEQAPENKHDRERKPMKLTDQCNNCNKTYAINEHTGKLHEFYEQPECNYVMCTCPNCHYRTQIFLGEQQFIVAVQSGVPFRKVDEDNPPMRYADEETYKSWVEVKGITLPVEHELTARQEDLVSNFGKSITAMSAEMLMDGFMGDTEHPYPERWI